MSLCWAKLPRSLPRGWLSDPRRCPSEILQDSSDEEVAPVDSNQCYGHLWPESLKPRKLQPTFPSIQ